MIHNCVIKVVAEDNRFPLHFYIKIRDQNVTFSGHEIMNDKVIIRFFHLIRYIYMPCILFNSYYNLNYIQIDPLKGETIVTDFLNRDDIRTIACRAFPEDSVLASDWDYVVKYICNKGHNLYYII